MDRGWRYFYATVFATGALVPNIVFVIVPISIGFYQWLYARMGYQMGQGALLALWCVLGNQALSRRLLISLIGLTAIMTLSAMAVPEVNFSRAAEVFLHVMPVGLIFVVSAIPLLVVRAISKNVIAHKRDPLLQQGSQINLRSLLMLTLVIASLVGLLRYFDPFQLLLDARDVLLSISVGLLAYAVTAAAVMLSLAWIALTTQRSGQLRALGIGTVTLAVCVPFYFLSLHFFLGADIALLLWMFLVVVFCSAFTMSLGLLALRWLGYRLRKLPLQ